MSGAISAAATQPQAQRAIVRSVQSERLFYVVAGSVMLIATVVGFRAFLAHGKAFGGGEITRQIVPWSLFMVLPCSAGYACFWCRACSF